MYDQLPQKLKGRKNFCLWKYEMRNGKQTKVPYMANGKRANSADRRCFTDFERVCASLDGFDGIGIGIFDDLFAIDIDYCITDGIMSDMAKDIMDLMKPPSAVTSATSLYREDSDKVWQFVQERLEEAPTMEVRTSEVYECYRSWCAENGCYPENSRNFNQALRSFATVVRRRPQSGGGATTLLLGYRIRPPEFLSA